MSLYWRADDTVKVGETKISIPSENGLSYSPGQKIQIFVDPQTKFMDGKESYLNFDFKISLPDGAVPTRLQLDKMGGNALINNIRIYDGSRGNLLEEVNAYDCMCAVSYDYNTDKNLKNFRALREGGGVHQPYNRGTEGTSISAMSNTLTNPYFKKTTGNQSTTFSDSDFLTAKLNIPLQTGIFADSETIFPVMMTNGLYIEIDLNDAPKVLKQLESVNRNIRTGLGPIFHSVNGSSTPDNLSNGSTLSTFYVFADNSLDGADAVAKCPFVVGETIGFCRTDNNGSTIGFASGDCTISSINLSTAANGGNGLVEITIAPGRASDSGAGNDLMSGEYVVFSKACDGATSYDASYTVSNVNLVVSQVHLDPGYEAGMIAKVNGGQAIEFDIKSATNYKHSILASDRQTTFQVFANNSRAKSLLVVPTDSTVYNTAEQICGKTSYPIKGTNASETTGKDSQDTCLVNDRTGYTGISDRLSSYQYVIDGKRVPSREVSTKKIATKQSIDAFHLYELEKTLDNAGIIPRSFASFQDNFCFGRAFGVQNGAMDLRGQDLQVILKYQETDAPLKPKMFQSFIFHLRRLMIRSGGVEVQQ